MNSAQPANGYVNGKISRQKVGKLGLPFILVVIYLIMDYARPANPMKIPWAISALLFLYWVTLPKKIWRPQVICFCLLLCVIAAMGPFAVNSFSIWWEFRGMLIQLMFIGIPLIHILGDLRKLSSFVNVFVAIYVYVAIFGLLNGGQGPGGPIGDENDLALALNVAMPFAFVSIFRARNGIKKALFVGAFGLMVAGTVATFSRGGFIGLVPVLAYCFMLAPKKGTAAIIGILLSVGVWLCTPANYWSEMNTIVYEAQNTDPGKGTGALRKEFWLIARNMFYHNPIFGVGLGNFEWNASQYQTDEQTQKLGRTIGGTVAHSVYFTLLAELGLSGTLIFAALIWYNFVDIRSTLTAVKEWKKRMFFRRSRSIPAQETFLQDLETIRCYAHAVGASLLGYLISAIFLSVLTYPHFWLLSALTVVLKERTQKLLSEAAESSETGQVFDPGVLKPAMTQADG